MENPNKKYENSFPLDLLHLLPKQLALILMSALVMVVVAHAALQAYANKEINPSVYKHAHFA